MPSIKKINSILELLRQNYKMGLTNKEISGILDMPPSTCYRILRELRKYKFIYQRKSDMKYFLGFANLRFADAVVEGMDITTLSLPYLEELHKETEETTFLAVWQEPVCVVVEVVGFINTRVSVGRGEVMPFHASAAGKLVLAFLPGKEKNKILDKIELKKYTENTITNPDDLGRNLEEIYKTGISYNFQEFNNGISAMATPVFGRQDKIVAALAVVGTSIDLNRYQLAEYSSLFLKASAEISDYFGVDISGRFISGSN
ncbi:MAG: IclR family transcriptional regulator [Spirochaetes bacterium]|nr:IclR family transcriptional regulator [Spirochaetota bacterium]